MEFSNINREPNSGPQGIPSSNDYVDIGSSPNPTYHAKHSSNVSQYAPQYDNSGTGGMQSGADPGFGNPGYEKMNYDSDMRPNAGLYETMQYPGGNSLGGSRTDIMSEVRREDVVIVKKWILVACACAAALVIVILLAALIGVAVEKKDCHQSDETTAQMTDKQTGSCPAKAQVNCTGFLIEGVQLYHVTHEENYNQLMETIESMLRSIDDASATLGGQLLRLDMGHMTDKGIGLNLATYDYPDESLVDLVQKIPYYQTGSRPNIAISMEAAAEFYQCSNSNINKMLLIYTEDRHFGDAEELKTIIRKLRDDGVNVVPIGVKTPSGTITVEQLQLMSTSGKYFMANGYDDFVQNVGSQISAYLIKSFNLPIFG